LFVLIYFGQVRRAAVRAAPFGIGPTIGCQDELRTPDQPRAKPKKELPDPVGVLAEVTTFVELARDGAFKHRWPAPWAAAAR
jgi:hypothetical protein